MSVCFYTDKETTMNLTLVKEDVGWGLWRESSNPATLWKKSLLTERYPIWKLCSLFEIIKKYLTTKCRSAKYYDIHYFTVGVPRRKSRLTR